MSANASLDLSAPQRIHILGIGGAGMSGLAQVFHDMGHQVSGSDLVASSVTSRLAGIGIDIALGHDASKLSHIDLITASPAVSQDNPELLFAAGHNIPVVHRADMLAALSHLRPTIAVAGTHGKTTTSSMLALILITAGLDPSYLLGADLVGQGSNAHWGSGDVLVLEADESYGSFSKLAPAITGITNIEADHLDHYGTLESLEQGFTELLERTSGASAAMAWDEGARRVGGQLGALLVGSDQAPLRDLVLGRRSSSFTLDFGNGPLALGVEAPGRHNAANAALAATLASLAGVSDSDIAAGLASFLGVPRRFEFRAHRNGVTFVDDYAHLPSEVSATVRAAQAGGYGRIVAVFQPHRFTRTQAVGGEFKHSFEGADVVVITDIYSAGEAVIPGVSGRIVFDAVKQGSSAELHYVANVAEAAALVSEILTDGDLCLSLGAGDITELTDLIEAKP
jgi:UDP-N-acetylmuramate--alanine ligase